MIHAIQQELQTYILRRDQSKHLEILLQTNSSESALNIYYQGYRARLKEILSNFYPKLKIIVKNIEDDKETKYIEDNENNQFNRIAEEYIALFPSKHYSINQFGYFFPHFLDTHPIYNNKPYLAEMAVFEWYLGEALHAADGLRIGLEELQAIPAFELNDITIEFHPSIQVLDFFWNVPEVWQSIDESKEINFLKNEIQQSWIIGCLDFQSKFQSELQSALQSEFEKNEVFYRAINGKEKYIFSLVNQKLPFGDICEYLCEIMAEDGVPSFIVNCLQRWVQEGIISNLKQKLNK